MVWGGIVTSCRGVRVHRAARHCRACLTRARHPVSTAGSYSFLLARAAPVVPRRHKATDAATSGAGPAGGSGGSTLDEEELRRFRRLSHTFWHETGEYGALHALNALRVPLVRDGLTRRRDVGGEPLEGLRIADVGCGGGILSEPLARLGARVLGVDASQENVDIARAHMVRDTALHDRLEYQCTTVEDLVDGGRSAYDAVVASEVLEHVNNPDTFVAACVDLVKPGGSLFFTTLNKTRLAYLGGVLAAENLLRLVPPGTHDWSKFISPQDLTYYLQCCGCSVRVVHGMVYNPLTKRWSWSRRTPINYALHAVKHDASS